jgi:hypothetical protein
MLTLEKYSGFLLLFTFFAGLVLKKLLAIIGINIAGLDYILWFFTIVQLFTFSLLRRKVSVPQNYYIILLIVVCFLIINYFTSNYIHSISSYIIGSLITLIFPLTFIAAYNINLNRNDIITLIRNSITAITVLLVILFFERLVNGAFFSGKRIASHIIKTYGFIGTISSINVVFSLFMFKEKKEKKYKFHLLFSLFMIGHLVMLKSIASTMFVFVIFFFFYSNKGVLRKTLYILISLFGVLIITSSIPSINTKITKYKKYYLNTSGKKLTPRLALYRESFHIASDHFPMGSGQGTYGSYPVMRHYSKVYSDYGLSHRHGLMFKKEPNFLFDSYWSSIIAEMGYVGAFFYVVLFFLPLIFVSKYRKIKENKIFIFFVVGILSIIFIESLALAIPYQISFIVIYAGFTGVVLKMMKLNSDIDCENNYSTS